eukprot:gene12567-26463_t
MYGPGGSSGGGDRGGFRGGGDRRMTPRGQMSGGANQRPPLSDLPPNMKLMFEPRPPLQYKPLLAKPSMPQYTGIAALVKEFETTPPPVPIPFETPRDRKMQEKLELQRIERERLEIIAQDWDPNKNRKATHNAYHTLFVGRLSYDMNEKKLKRELEQYGPITDVKLVMGPDGKPRGYAFVEFQ